MSAQSRSKSFKPETTASTQESAENAAQRSTLNPGGIPMIGFSYNFPAHKDVGRLGTRTQALKVRGEACELLGAVEHREGTDRVLEEALDTMHACETLLRSYPVKRVKKARDAVVAKNAARSYYEGGAM